MGDGKRLKDNRQIYLNIQANSKPFFAVSFFVNYSFFLPLSARPPRGTPFVPRLSPFSVSFRPCSEWSIMQVILATLWNSMKSAKYIYDLFCPEDKGTAHKKNRGTTKRTNES